MLYCRSVLGASDQAKKKKLMAYKYQPSANSRLRAKNIQEKLRTLHKSREANKLAIRVSLPLQMLSKFPHKSQGHFRCIHLHQQSAAASSSSLATTNAPAAATTAATSPKSPKSPTR
jgi:hypothetical protein